MRSNFILRRFFRRVKSPLTWLGWSAQLLVFVLLISSAVLPFREARRAQQEGDRTKARANYVAGSCYIGLGLALISLLIAQQVMEHKFRKARRALLEQLHASTMSFLQPSAARRARSRNVA